ncbi:uncharacterized protein Z520_06685 [Fonsecaea multimorphosa CBS 102226]|uniref:Anaphase-promoting complex subunit 4 WD40 domain-containing protein n=1 Tax=Fonsecaea multimorphosa CBS 102226 TaxID=1442371 RepID=A0A0D2JWL8_9EURO|nr:uncharacterized protein Z520_06685 [Fonsecaea multimorphosa CBS 102226]KIX97907.1 hypothetical protein Z520_06685 [Fonsecaea multimorphosa CBS 102226]OAL23677.1 hypothetical protein AYO22_06254 [Fonsecaea multimorphosa]
MVKRKRENGNGTASTLNGTINSTGDQDTAAKVTKTNGHVDVKTTSPVIQIVVGSYERVLHGITASISNLSSPVTPPSVQFADTFLFNAHASAIKCLALSPLPEPGSSETQGVYLATGGSDEKVNVFSLAASPVADNERLPPMPSLGKNTISENPKNRELGTLLHHSSHITALHFPTRSKLLSGSEDNTIAVTRLKDLTVVSTIKAPRPKAQGQPSGDTAPPGATPAGINDFSVHPSMKLMLSVGRGERCMRLWNLVTGKKAGVLNFGREILQSVREGKYSSGEGRRIRWNPNGSEFAVAFERGGVVFGEDSKPKCRAVPEPLTKLHQICYQGIPSQSGGAAHTTLLALSTEDGRILFYDTEAISPRPLSNGTNNNDQTAPASIPDAALVATVGGKTAGLTTRIKDFELLFLPPNAHGQKDMAIVTASSDGTIRVILLSLSEVFAALKNKKPVQAGRIIGAYETSNRITCLTAFVMLPPEHIDDEDEFGEEDGEFRGFDGQGESEQSESSSDED